MSLYGTQVRDLRFPKALLEPIRHMLQEKKNTIGFSDVLKQIGATEDDYNSSSFSINGEQALGLFFWLRTQDRGRIFLKDWVGAYSLTSVGLIGLAVMAAGTLREALLLPAKYLHLYLPLVKLDLIEAKETARLEVRLTNDLADMNRFFIEQVVGVIHSLQSELVAAPIDVTIHFKHELSEEDKRRDKLHQYQKLFGENVRFGSYFDGLEAKVECLDLPLRRTNDASYQVAVGLLEDEVGRNNSQTGFDTIVRSELMRLGREGQFPSLEDFADRMSYSPRTLMRKLKSHNTSFKAMSNEVRLILSKDLLSNSKLSIKQVASKSGFNNTNSFSRAYKALTGFTPMEWRSKLKSSDG